MDTNKMVNIKPEPKINEGRELLKELDKQGLNPEVAMWFYIPDGNIWRFVVGSSSFNDKTIQTQYSDFVNKYKDLEQIKAVGIENITLLPSNNNLIALLKNVIRTGSKDIGDIRFTSNVINGVLIDDAVIYRLT